AQLERHLINYVGRDAMDIKGFGTENIRALIREGLLNGIADLYRLKDHRDRLVEAGIVGREKNTDKLILSIEKSKENEPDRLLTGLAIPNVGRTSARTLIRHFGGFAKLMDASKEQLREVPDIGGVTAEAIRSFFADPVNRALIEELKEFGLTLEAEEKSFSAELAGKTFVVTGSLEHFPNREALAELILSHGGKTAGSVSKKTTALINNDLTSMSGKNKKAKELGIPILSEEDFLKLLNGENAQEGEV
ncbi:MAG: NAD-dependent DNA ligase LigA, partial [Lachnospiraceae bacterium]|nr:NAD-dependent DNA ligase LigA [Lachnospiraceae bacterium]